MRKYFSLDFIVFFYENNSSRGTMASIVREDIEVLLTDGSLLLNALKAQYSEMNLIENNTFEIFIVFKLLKITKHTRITINEVEFKKLIIDFEKLSHDEKLSQILPQIDSSYELVSVDEINFDSLDDKIVIYKSYKQKKRIKNILKNAINEINQLYNYNSYNILNTYL